MSRHGTLLLAAAVFVGGICGPVSGQDVDRLTASQNGDVNGDGAINIGDAIYILNWRFSDGPPPVELAPAEPSPAEIVVTTSAAVQDWATENEVGTSQLVRTEDGVWMTLETTGIPDGHAVTVWWVVFNEPEKCRECGDGGPCGIDFCTFDVSDSLFAGGFVAGEGRGETTGYLAVGETAHSINPLFELDATGLTDPFAAEIHLVIRDHGPADCERIDQQIGTYEGDCSSCEDIQFVVHEPPSDS